MSSGLELQSFDYIVVGGGLQGGLIVMSLRQKQPSASILLIEGSEHLAGNHTWSFHPADVPDSALPWVQPLIEHSWQASEVCFRGRVTQHPLPYACTSSAYFAKAVTHRMGDGPGRLLLERPVSEVGPQHVRTATGELYEAKIVFDCRGRKSESSCERPSKLPGQGFQKFWGFEVETSSDWPRNCPRIMDDAADQTDGFRFVYTLPFTPRRILVEDTRFSNSPNLDREECLATVTAYLAKQGVNEWTIHREESGVLPMPYEAQGMPDRTAIAPVISGGYAGGWFHPATGYSFPLAVAFADTVANIKISSSQIGDTIRSAISKLALQHRARTTYSRFLNRLLFCLVKPTTRYQIFQRFYSVLTPAAIARFYAHRFTVSDAVRIVVGWPPHGLQPFEFLRSYFRDYRRFQATQFLSTTQPLIGRRQFNE